MYAVKKENTESLCHFFYIESIRITDRGLWKQGFGVDVLECVSVLRDRICFGLYNFTTSIIVNNCASGTQQKQ